MKARVVLSVVGLLALAAVLAGWSGIHRFLFTKPAPVESVGLPAVSVGWMAFQLPKKGITGKVFIRRWSDEDIRHGPVLVYWKKTGFKAVEGVYVDDQAVRMTVWKEDGTVDFQVYLAEGRRNESAYRSSPPWFWEVFDQQTPSLPGYDAKAVGETGDGKN